MRARGRPPARSAGFDRSHNGCVVSTQTAPLVPSLVHGVTASELRATGNPVSVAPVTNYAARSACIVRLVFMCHLDLVEALQASYLRRRFGRNAGGWMDTRAKCIVRELCLRTQSEWFPLCLILPCHRDKKYCTSRVCACRHVAAARLTKKCRLQLHWEPALKWTMHR